MRISIWDHPWLHNNCWMLVTLNLIVFKDWREIIFRPLLIWSRNSGALSSKYILEGWCRLYIQRCKLQRKDEQICSSNEVRKYIFISFAWSSLFSPDFYYKWHEFIDLVKRQIKFTGQSECSHWIGWTSTPMSIKLIF